MSDVTSFLRVSSLDGPPFFNWMACVVVVAGVLMMSQFANASCGDYLLGHRNPVTLSGEYVQNFAQSGETPLPSLPIRPSGPHCSGPVCHQTPLLPAEIPQGYQAQSTEKALYLRFVIGIAIEANWSEVGRITDRIEKSGHRDRLERPPQQT